MAIAAASYSLQAVGSVSLIDIAWPKGDEHENIQWLFLLSCRRAMQFVFRLVYAAHIASKFARLVKDDIRK